MKVNKMYCLILESETLKCNLGMYYFFLFNFHISLVLKKKIIRE